MYDQLSVGQPYRVTLKGTGLTGSDVDLATEPVAAGQLLAVNSIMVKDVENGATRVEVYAGPYGALQLVAISGALTAAVSLPVTQDFYVPDSQYIVVRFVGSTTADQLSAVINGTVRYAGGPGVEVETQE
jgi:hypothetical protein